jgi:hypothetical protein
MKESNNTIYYYNSFIRTNPTHLFSDDQKGFYIIIWATIILNLLDTLKFFHDKAVQNSYNFSKETIQQIFVV